MNPFAIAGVQMHVSATHDNIPRMRQKLDVLMHLYPWVQMVVYSELCAFGPMPQKAQPLPGPAEEAFRDMARKHGVWLVPGSLYEKSGDKIHNTAPVIDPAGEVVARYRKIFPFRPYETGVEEGDEFVVFDVPGVARFGLLICYDMWFPETARTLAVMGAEVILHPVFTPTIDREVELAIARATAACNQCFVIDINGVGDGGNGRSIFVGPAGDVLHQARTSEEDIPLEIDIERVRRGREIGLRALGQPLKSFRDRGVEFSVYRPGASHGYLASLGPLVKPTRGSRAGLDRHPAALDGETRRGEDPPRDK